MSGNGGDPSPSQDLSVVPDDVRDVGRYAFNLAENLRTALDSAGREVNGLLSGGWRGPAATGFAGSWTETHDGGRQVIDALTTLADKLGVTAATYRKTDDSRAAGLRESSLDL